jgi:hypothetical protein
MQLFLHSPIRVYGTVLMHRDNFVLYKKLKYLKLFVFFTLW